MHDRKKVAAVVTEYRHWSHADVILGKLLEGYLHDGNSKEEKTLTFQASLPHSGKYEVRFAYSRAAIAPSMCR